MLAEPSEAGGRGGATDLPRHSQLRVDVREVSLDRAHAEAEPVGDCFVREPARHQLEHLQLPRAELRDTGGGLTRRAGAEEPVELGEEVLPRGLVAQQDVVLRVEQD